MLHITQAITPFIRVPRAGKFTNPEASPRSLESFPGDEAEVLLQDFISARELREQVGRQLDEELDAAVGDAQQENIRKQINIFEKFIEMKYFDGIEGYEISVNRVRSEIRQALEKYTHIAFGPTMPTSPIIPTSSLSSNRISVYGSSPPKKPTVLPEDERLELALTAVAKGSEVRSASNTFGVSRSTMQRRLRGKRSRAEFCKSRQLLSEEEETSILRFVDQFTLLGFPPRLSTIREKVMLLLKNRGVDHILGENWTGKFLNRHPEFKLKFPRHLDQDRHFNSNAEVFANWFELYRKTCADFRIAEGDRYNMDEKGFLMGVGGEIQ